jgi:pyocin large subunit-like protein
MTGRFLGSPLGRIIAGLPLRRLLMAALSVVAIVVYWSQAPDRAGRVDAHESAAAETGVSEAGAPADQRSAGKSWGAGIGFADTRRLEEHYEKHGVEFGHITKQDYLRQAQLLRDARVGGPVLETVRADRVATRFDRQTGAFIAFNPNGTIRTFFKPNDGERYYRRQAERIGE